MNPSQLLLSRLLERSGGPTETGFVLVLDGEGLESLPEQMATSQGTYTVHRTSTEIGLRHLLWKAKGAPLIAVIPGELAHKLPPDLLRRSRYQRVHALSVNDVLEVVLGVRVVGAESHHLQTLAMTYLESISRAMTRRTLPTVVDRKLLTELLVDASVGEMVRSLSPAELLASWIGEPPAWLEEVRTLVTEALPSLHGDEGRLLAWALAAEGRLDVLMIHGALLTVEGDELPRKVWGPLWAAAAHPPLSMDRRILRRTACRLVEDALGVLADAASGLLDKADKLGRELLTASQFQTSHVLPLAFQGRCHSLAQSAAEGKPIPGSDIAWLKAHRAAPMGLKDIEVLEAIARVTRWLDRPQVLSADIAAQTREYLQQSAFADLAAWQLRRALAASSGYHGEARRVLERWRSRRDKQNEHFAKSIAADYEAALHHPEVVPLHRIWQRMVAPVWSEDPDARIYLVVLDGCSHTVFLELLFELSQDSVFPVGITPNDRGEVAGLPALAPLPTITCHTRGSIFLGQLPHDPLVAETVFRDQSEAVTDKARFNQNPSLGSRSRRLFLKGDLADGGGALREALRDDGIQVVASVFSAVDEQIGSSNTSAVYRITPQDIIALKPSLRTALTCGRKVLVTADHGHSPFLDKALRVGAGSAHRFVSLQPSEVVPEGFAEVDVAGLGGEPARRAFAWRMGAYMGMPQVGFHGGCGLEEMAVPLAWLEREGLQADEPEWWFGRGLSSEPTLAPRPVTPPVATPLPSQPPETQTNLFKPSTRIDVLQLPLEMLDALSEDEQAVLVLLHDNGSARTSELAERMNKTPMRLNGLIRALRRKLYGLGHVMFSDEVLPDGETLYTYLGPEEQGR